MGLSQRTQSALSVIMALRSRHCGNPRPSVRDRRQERVAFFKIAQRCYRDPDGALAGRRVRAVRIVECLGDYTVLMVVARQNVDVRTHRASRILGRAWDACGGGAVGRAGRKPRSDGISPKENDCLRVRFWRPSRIRTCAHASGEHSRIQPLPAETQPDQLAWGAYGTRGIVVLSFAICRHRLHDPEGHILH
jgi:hypothetical protein